METMATIELDLTNIPSIKCSIFAMGANYSTITPGLSRILHTCASIPVTVRTLIKYWDREHASKLRGLDISNLSLFCAQDGEFLLHVVYVGPFINHPFPCEFQQKAPAKGVVVI